MRTYIIGFTKDGRSWSFDIDTTIDDARDFALKWLAKNGCSLVQVWRPHPVNGIEPIGVYRP